MVYNIYHEAYRIYAQVCKKICQHTRFWCDLTCHFTEISFAFMNNRVKRFFEAWITSSNLSRFSSQHSRRPNFSQNIRRTFLSVISGFRGELTFDQNLTNGIFSSGSQCWFFSHEPSSLSHHSVLADLSVFMMQH